MTLLLALLPIVGALFAGLVPDTSGRTPKLIALVVTLLTLGLSLFVLSSFDAGSAKFQQEVMYDLFPKELGISAHFGMDGISLWLVILTSLLSVVAVAFSFYVDKRPRLFMAMLLLLEGAMIGSFVSLDLIFFFTFFELTLIPMWLIINLWGGGTEHLRRQQVSHLHLCRLDLPFSRNRRAGLRGFEDGHWVHV